MVSQDSVTTETVKAVRVLTRNPSGSQLTVGFVLSARLERRDIESCKFEAHLDGTRYRAT